MLAVIDGPTLEKYNLHWMPTISADTQMVLPIDEVMYQAQEVCAVIATERYIAAEVSIFLIFACAYGLRTMSM